MSTFLNSEQQTDGETAPEQVELVNLMDDTGIVNPYDIVSNTRCNSIIILVCFGYETPRSRRLQSWLQVRSPHNQAVTVLEVGTIYGGENGELSRWFRCMHNLRKVEPMKETVHIQDLASIINYCAAHPSSDGIRFIRATDHAVATESRVSELLGIESSRTSRTPSDSTQTHFDTEIQWVSRGGIPEHIEDILVPFNRDMCIIIVGPPCSGKTTLAMKLAGKLGMQYICLKPLTDDAETKGGIPLTYDVLDEYEWFIRKAVKTRAKKKRFSEDLTAGIVGYRIKRPDCRFFGCVLDGFPRTDTEAREINKLGWLPKQTHFVSMDTSLDKCTANLKDKENTPASLLPHDSSADLKRRYVEWSGRRERLCKCVQDETNWIVSSPESIFGDVERIIAVPKRATPAIDPINAYLANNVALLQRIEAETKTILEEKPNNPVESLARKLMAVSAH